MPPRFGATLLELMLVVALLAVAATIAIPRAGRLLDRARVSSAITEGVATLAAARHLAIARGRRSTVTIDTATATLTVLVGTDTAHRRPLGTTHGVTLSATRDSLAYHPTGLGYGGANLTIQIARGRAVDSIVVSRLGRVRH